MPTAANITVKKADNTTDQVWTLVAASGGDKTPAAWRNESATGTIGQRPTFLCSSRWSGDRQSRRLDMKGSFPSVYTDTNSGLTQVRATAVMNASLVVPVTMLDADISEFAAQIANLMASTLLKSAVTTGYAPA